jgi:hypothetical protein
MIMSYLLPWHVQHFSGWINYFFGEYFHVKKKKFQINILKNNYLSF